MSNKIKISVFSLFRDSETHLSRVLAQYESFLELNNFEFCFFFYQNDSKDNTKEILEEWAKKDPFYRFLLNETVNSPKFGSVPSQIRTGLLSYYRNKNKKMALANTSDYSLIIDSDLYFDKSHIEILYNAINSKNNTVMVTSNCVQNVPDYTFGLSKESYYDVFCFRDKYGSNGMYFSSCPFFNEEDYDKWNRDEMVKTQSSFGGFALVRSEAFNKVKWSSELHSEHVNFCFELGQYGNIYSVPTCKVKTIVDLVALSIDPEKCKGIGREQFKNFMALKQLYKCSISDEFIFPFTK